MLQHCQLKISRHNRFTLKHCRSKSTCNSRNITIYRHKSIRLSLHHHSIMQCSKTGKMYTMLAKYIDKLICEMFHLKYCKMYHAKLHVWHQLWCKSWPQVVEQIKSVRLSYRVVTYLLAQFWQILVAFSTRSSQVIYHWIQPVHREVDLLLIM